MEQLNVIFFFLMHIHVHVHVYVMLYSFFKSFSCTVWAKLNKYPYKTCFYLLVDKAVNTKKGRMFSEGWIEFEDKKVAKKVASKLNSSQIGGKKKSRWYDEIWSLRYLHR